MTITDEVLARRRLPTPAMAREIRRAAGVSQARVARELGVTAVAVSRWENGRRTPRGSDLMGYLRILDKLRRATA